MPETFITSRKEEIPLEQRHANEMAVYDAMADELMASWTDDDWRIDADSIPHNHQFEGPMQTLIDWSQPLEGSRVLETGSGFGEITVWLALQGAEVVATDISPKCLSVVEERARRNGVEDRITTICTPVEKAEGIEDGSVDLVFGRTVAHHFDLGPAARSMYRALRPGGRAVFAEPVLLLPDWVFRVRRSRPVTRFFPPFVHTPDERSFDQEMIDDLCAPFDSVTIRYFGLFNRVSNFVKVPDKLFAAMDRGDQAILDRVDGARKFSRYMVIRLDKRPA
jgi:SAM-dependent methyltransferase